MVFEEITDMIERSFDEPTKPRKRPKTHNYEKPRFGHKVRVTRVNGTIIDISGWGKSIRRKDFILMKGPGGSVRYRFTMIRYESDEYWVGQAEFSPRKGFSL